MKIIIISIIVFFVQSTFAIDASSKRVAFGFSDSKGTSVGGTFHPGEEINWKFSRTRSGIELTSQEEDSTNNHMIEAYLMRTDMLFNSIEKYIETINKNLIEAFAVGGQWRLVSVIFEPEASKPRCARGHILLRDRSNNKDVDARFSEQFILSCALERHAPFGIEVRYYHRYKGGNRDAEFSTKANQLLNSIEVEDK